MVGIFRSSIHEIRLPCTAKFRSGAKGRVETPQVPGLTLNTFHHSCIGSQYSSSDSSLCLEICRAVTILARKSFGNPAVGAQLEGLRLITQVTYADLTAFVSSIVLRLNVVYLVK